MWTVRSLFLLLVHLASILLFCKGFFPSKVVLDGYGEFDDPSSFKPQFNKVVVMVVDALRSDFVFSDKSSMLFTQSLLRNGSAIGYTAFSNPPTVTLPRLKGITTGSTPNFLDAVLNVVEEDTSSTLANQDSWIKQLKMAGKRIHMFGDDTWIKLFPGVFDISDGTNSFFVSDFTEVDNNVTRHLDQELSEQNWDCLILHYLGLDHIGHKGGPESPFMPVKQKEMDAIVERIYQSLQSDTLLVVLGDHGMNELGNHGGSSAGETSAALLFASKKFESLGLQNQSPLPYNDEYKYYQKIQQIDLVPTLCSLIHIPTPKNSLGVFIKEFLQLWPQNERSSVLRENLVHYKKFEDSEVMHTDSEDVIYQYLTETQSSLTRSATNYDDFSIQIALSILTLIAFINIVILKSNLGVHSIVILGFTLIYGLTVFGSSLIEEEHQIWWWIATLAAVVFVHKKPFNLAAILVLIRVLRGWNNSGQKFVGDTVFETLESFTFLKWLIVFLTISSVGFSLNNGGFSRISPMISFVITFTLSVSLFAYKLLFAISNGEAIPHALISFVAWTISMLQASNAQDCLVDVARMIFSIIGGTLVLRVALRLFKGESYWFMTDIHNIITFTLIMQTSSSNIGIFLVLLGLKAQIGDVFESFGSVDSKTRTAYLTIVLLVLQNLTFFSMGQTNSLNTVDLSNAYNGVKSYDLVAVGVLTFLSNFAGPIYWACAALPIMFECLGSSKDNKWGALRARWIVNSVFYTMTTLLIFGSCYAQRYHLFIWTVFSPKILYTLVWNFFMNLLVELVIVVIVYFY
ncbi:CYFA0S15e01882g1_1 [Cyberlindnera fabianii]|uniref:GPI ethanolamine phosphate transferase 2 n=1 Tax=Cyberlindnera fabianii TaxID=36022 RepID=A0A061BCN1_CYBFA|nr:CYFA0S15e01882g1_1 [Cyberlindnera fabianii]